MNFLNGNDGGLIAFLVLVSCFCWYSSHSLNSGRRCSSCGHSGLSANAHTCPACGSSLCGSRGR